MRRTAVRSRRVGKARAPIVDFPAWRKSGAICRALGPAALADGVPLLPEKAGGRMSREARLAAILLAVIGMTAALMGVYATDWGPWVGSDSVEYLESARNLASGRGLVTE